VAKRLTAEHPDLNVLINNAGIMEPDQAAGVIDDKLLVSTVATNLLGPIRLTSALVNQLKSRRGVIVYNTSVLAYVPLAVTAIYSATKAALHSYVLSQRFLLRDSDVRVLEMASPWVRTELMNSQEAEQQCLSTSSSPKLWTCLERMLTKFLLKQQSLCEPIREPRSMPW
jgi:uncharacterized oxidoreductase